MPSNISDLSNDPKAKYKRGFGYFRELLVACTRSPQMILDIKYDKDMWEWALAAANYYGFIEYKWNPKDKNGAAILNAVLVVSKVKVIWDAFLALQKQEQEAANETAEDNGVRHRDDGIETQGERHSVDSDRDGLVGSDGSSPKVESKEGSKQDLLDQALESDGRP